MTIKEIEQLAGMPRANIRFYEAEGLLNPSRTGNGYRDYSEEDLAVLKKIKLLRSLHLSLEEIKKLHTGQQELSVALEQHIKQLSADKEEQDKAQSVCEIMYREGVPYKNLDAEKYLAKLKIGVNPHTIAVNPEKFSWELYWDTREAYEDTLPNIQAPWRRFFARILDEAFYSVIWSCFLVLVLDRNLLNREAGAEFVDSIMLLLFTLLLEPLQLALFGTTIGKGILGIHIWHNDDRKLSLSEAFDRTKQVLFYGLGLHIPIFNLIRMWKSYKACMERETLVWEYDSRIILKDEGTMRTVAYVGAHVVLMGVLLLANTVAQFPPNRKSLTIPQFCENYRDLADYYGVESGYILGNNGEWSANTPEGSVVVIYPFGQEEPPKFIFTTDSEGIIQEISFTVDKQISKDIPKEDRPWMSAYQTQIQLAALAFVGAQEEFSQFSSARSKLVEKLSSNSFRDYSFTEAGVTVSCDVEMQGYHVVGDDLLIPSDEGECFFYLQFRMSITE